MVQEIKKRGLKYSLICCTFLIFYKEGTDTLPRDDIEKLVEEEIRQNKNKIISSHTERSCVLETTNYKKKLRDILKKKKWFIKRVNSNGEIEYTMIENIVAPVMPRIISQLKSLNTDADFLNDKEEKKEIKPMKKKFKKEFYYNNIKFASEHDSDEDEDFSNIKIKKEKGSQSETKLTGYKRKASESSLDRILHERNFHVPKKFPIVEEKEDDTSNNDETNIKVEEEKLTVDFVVHKFFRKFDSLIKIISTNSVNEMTSKKINSIQNHLLEKQKEVDTQKLMLQRLILNSQKYKLYDENEIKVIIDKLKINLQEYRSKFEVLSFYQQYTPAEQKEDEIKLILNNTKLIRDECTQILDKIFIDLSKLFKNYIDFGDLVNILFDERDENWLKENIISSDDKDYINTNIDNLKLPFYKNLYKITSNINMILDENSVTNYESNINSLISD